MILRMDFLWFGTIAPPKRSHGTEGVQRRFRPLWKPIPGNRPPFRKTGHPSGKSATLPETPFLVAGFPPDWVAGLLRNQWPVSSGITGRFRPEYALSGPVEVDETFIGGKERNKHSSKKSRAGRGTVGKTPVVGVKDRETKRVEASVVRGTTREDLEGFIQERVEPGSTVYTDDHSGYCGLWLSFEHQAVRHNVKEYVKGQAHTNGIESFWALLKRGYYGTFHRMSPKHLQKYVDEFAGRHNLRPLDTIDQMKSVVRGMEGKRLRYKELVG